MSTQSNQWMLFGFDVRTVGQQWMSAWKTLLFSEHTPFRQRFDEPVLLRDGTHEHVYQGGRAVDFASAEKPNFGAVQLPDDLVLDRSLTVPAAAEAELQAVLAMEVAAGSPFSPEDTVFGYRELSRGEQGISIQLAIASRAGINEWLNAQDWLSGEAGTDTLEVWADVDGAKVSISGFGEASRERAYRQRLVRAGLVAAAALLLVLLSASLFAMQQRAALGKLESLQARVQDQSESAAFMRESLVSANDTIAAANELIAQYPNPHLEIARLTELLKDDVFLAHFSMRGADLRIRGRASDAAVVMQTLAETDEYANVTAPQAITAVGTTGLEQFHLDIALADGATDEGGEE
ncbi:MAG: PilN domain-containing protein [Pseudomonadota bacterium]